VVPPGPALPSESCASGGPPQAKGSRRAERRATTRMGRRKLVMVSHDPLPTQRCTSTQLVAFQSWQNSHDDLWQGRPHSALTWRAEGLSWRPARREGWPRSANSDRVPAVKPRVLFVSKPIVAPFHDGTKCLVRDIASHLSAVRPLVLGVPGAKAPLRVDGEPA